jgi:ABC-2 type transport system permease protein
MKKIYLIGWKDLTLVFRDRAALVFMLAAPFLLTVGLGLVSGSFTSSTGGGFSAIPVALVDQDGGAMGEALVGVFQSDDLRELVIATVYTDPARARLEVDEDRAAAVVVVPAGFTASIMAPPGRVAPPQVEVYTNPSRPNSSGIVRGVVESFLNRVEVERAAGMVAATLLVENGLAGPPQAAQVGQAVGADWQARAGVQEIVVRQVTAQGEAPSFNPLAVMAPGMALMFLMFTVSNGGRSLLAERTQGTLPRLLVTPTAVSQILGGKVLGIFLSGAAQMLILIGGTALAFRIDWGSPLPVLALVLAAVAGAVGWGVLITALAKTPNQVSTVGSAMMLVFGILGGAFISLENMPAWFQLASKITPNAHGLNGFTTLAMGGGLADILPQMLALLAMGAALFALAAVVFSRKGWSV